MASLPYFPIFPKDICTDDRITELKGEERGLFLYFLCWLWIKEDEIKDNDSRISRILGISEKKWNILKLKLLNSGLLKIDIDSCLRNNRLTKLKIETDEKCLSNSKAAKKMWADKKSANKKSGKEERDENTHLKLVTQIVYPDDDDGMAINT